ncbi:MAG: JAB domain-containing protein [Actinomycetota bacterium]
MTERYRLELVRERAPAPFGAEVSAPRDLARLAWRLIGREAQEVVLCLHLDSTARLRGFHEVARGGLDVAPVDLRVIFAGLLAAASPAFALVHNHPSGDPKPSSHDLAVNDRVEAAAQLIGVRFLDHLIVAARTWSSLRECGGPW